MVLSEEDRDLDVHDRIIGERPALHPGDHALLDRGDELVGNDAALDLVGELESLAALARLEAEMHFSELPAASGLLLVPVLIFGLLADRLQIGYARLVEQDLDAEALLEPID